MDQQEQEKDTSITLPPEIWLERASRLDYFDLKKRQRVSKAFSELTKNPALDGALFRAQRPLSQLPTTMRPITHPIFDEVNHVARKVERVSAFGKEGRDYAVAELQSICEEMATYPSRSRLGIRGLVRGGEISNSDEKGVTVGEHFHKAVELWNKPRLYKDNSGAYIVRVGDFGTQIEYHTSFCYDSLFEESDHVFFEGWNSCKVDGIGRIVLEANGFGL